MTQTRIEKRFQDLAAAGRGALVTFITAGDPDLQSSAQLLAQLPEAGADIIELGMPFSDPMADGPSIQASSLRALAAGSSLIKTLEMVAEFRKNDQTTPIILMGYFNPIYAYGAEAFIAKAAESGVDGLIIVDLPPEEDAELRIPATKSGIHMIRLVTPTTDDQRLPTVIEGASGFLYYVSVLGITGTRSADQSDIKQAVDRLKKATDLPIAVGFGIKTPDQAAAIAKTADAAVVGSALVNQIAAHLDADGQVTPELLPNTLAFVKQLSAAIRQA